MKAQLFSFTCAVVLCGVGAPALARQAASPASPSASASTSTELPSLPPGFVIGPEDILTIVFWRDKDMTGDVQVRPDGKISVALINEVQAAGLTPEQLRGVLSKAASKYIEDPNVTVVVKEIRSRKVFITGQVGKPSNFPLIGEMTVLQLIAQGGGLLEYADSIEHHRCANRERTPAAHQVQLQGRAEGQKPGHCSKARRHSDRAVTALIASSQVKSSFHFIIIAGAAVLCLIDRPAFAQSVGTDRPYRGLFRGESDTSTTTPPRPFVGGFRRRTTITCLRTPVPASHRRRPDQWFLHHVPHRRVICMAGTRVQLAATSGSAWRYYPSESTGNASHTAAIGLSAQFTKRTSLSVNQTAAYSPSYLYGLFPSVTVPAPGDVVPVAPDYAIG